MKLLSRNTVAARLGISIRTLERLLAAGEGPAFLRVGRRILFRDDLLIDWIASR
jgi:excisionase family DNA binding protein